MIEDERDRSTGSDLDKKIWALWDQGICPTCRDFETGEVFEDAYVVHEDDEFRVVLAEHPVTPGETILVFKPHRADLSALSDEEASSVVAMCIRLMNALKQALDVEKVYLVTMCDGLITHLHFTLLPRYEGEYWGISRFSGTKSPLENGHELCRRINEKLIEQLSGQGLSDA